MRRNQLFAPFMHPVFVYGTLLVDEILLAVLGRTVTRTPAVLHGYFRGTIDGQVYPGITPHEGSSVLGAILGSLSASELTALDEYEGELYERKPVAVLVAGQTISALSYVVHPRARDLLTRTPWDLSAFKREHTKNFGLTWV